MVWGVLQYFCPVGCLQVLIFVLEVPFKILVQQVLSLAHEVLEHIIDELGIEVPEQRVHQPLVVPITPWIVVPFVQKVL